MTRNMHAVPPDPKLALNLHGSSMSARKWITEASSINQNDAEELSFHLCPGSSILVLSHKQVGSASETRTHIGSIPRRRKAYHATAVES